MKNQGLLFSTILLTAVNVLVRILGFGYRIVLVRLIGSEGLGLFELISPIIMLVFTLVGSGVPIAVIRLTSQAIAKKSFGHSLKITEYVSFIMVGVSLVLSVLLFITAPFIAKNILKDVRLLTPLYIFAPAILFPSLAATFRGYFYGVKNVIPPAIAQLVEQTSRMLIVFFLLSLLFPFSTDTAVSISMVGTVTGELVGMLMLFLFFNKAKKNYGLTNERIKVSPIKTLGSFSAIAIPITFSRIISSILRVATSIIIPQRLVVSGLDKSTSLSYFGQVNGMVMPLLFLPFTLTSSLVMNLIPRISEAVESNNHKLLHYYLTKTIHIAFLIGLPVSGIFYVFSDKIFWALYGEISGIYLSQLSIASLFLCVYQITASIMQGMGKQLISTIYFIGGMVLQFILTYILVAQPGYQIQGYIISFIISFAIIALLNFLHVFYFTKVKINVTKWILIPSLSALCALAMSKYFYTFISVFFNEIFSLLFSLFIMIAIYLGLLYVTKNIQYILKKTME